MWFAAKEAHERRVAEKRRRERLPERRQEGFQEGFGQGFLEGFRQGREEVRREERERISRVLAEHGVTVPAEVVARILSDG